MGLPAEEDVLAFLVLEGALAELVYETFGSAEWSDVVATYDDWKMHDCSRVLETVAHERLLAHDRNYAKAIGDSERRVQVELAEREGR